MSKQELDKWQNKYRLWHKLHPHQGFERCRSCNHGLAYYELGKMNCPTHLLIDRRGVKHLIEINTAEEKLEIGDICIEWIKDA